jgi:23S rRNA pseudouridine1911/1915/1917 synthase
MSPPWLSAPLPAPVHASWPWMVSLVLSHPRGLTFDLKLDSQNDRIFPGRLTVALASQQMRLDQFLAVALPEYSRSRAARMIKAGLVTVNGNIGRAATTLRAGDTIELTDPPPVELPPSPAEAPAIDVIFANDELIVVNKPAGMTVHPAPGHPHSTLVDALLARFPELMQMAEPGGIMRPGIVHRLDKDTSGVMVVARAPFARTHLARQFKDRTVRKTYLAIVRGIFARDRHTITQPVGRHSTERKRMSVRSHNPREAVSRVLALHRFADLPAATLMRIRPETGRTHQIRVHLAASGHPCAGDALYGGRSDDGLGFTRQALHALALELDDPRTGARLTFHAPLPSDFSAFLTSRRIALVPTLVTQWLSAS